MAHKDDEDEDDDEEDDTDDEVSIMFCLIMGVRKLNNTMKNNEGFSTMTINNESLYYVGNRLCHGSDSDTFHDEGMRLEEVRGIGLECVRQDVSNRPPRGCRRKKNYQHCKSKSSSNEEESVKSLDDLEFHRLFGTRISPFGKTTLTPNIDTAHGKPYHNICDILRSGYQD